MLAASERPLSEAYDLAMLDLDGVVYVGGDAVPGAAAHLRTARAGGLRTAFITNNASRPPDRVAAHLVELGVDAVPEDVVTSAQAAARLLLDRLGTGAAVLCLGGEGLESALLEAGLRPVGVDDDAEAAVSGYGPQVRWGDIMRAAVRIKDGLGWVATNTDATFPTGYGVAPGHGVLVDTLRRFTGVEPVVAGKPERPLLDETVRRVGGRRPLMVGDRLDTDIEGARRAGVDALLVRTGVTGLAEIVRAAPEQRPTYLAADLGGLLEPHPTPTENQGVHAAGGWRARVRSGTMSVAGGGAPDDWWRAVASAAWAHLDATGEPADVDDLVEPEPPGVPGSTPAAG